jgi:hypothetical protein
MSFLPSWDPSTVSTLLDVEFTGTVQQQFIIRSNLLNFFFMGTYGNVLREIEEAEGDPATMKAINSRIGKINTKKGAKGSGIGVMVKVAPSTGRASRGYGVVALEQTDDPSKMQKGATPWAIYYPPAMIVQSDLELEDISSEAISKPNAFVGKIAGQKRLDAIYRATEMIRDDLYAVDASSTTVNMTLQGNDNPQNRLPGMGLLSLIAPFYNSGIASTSSSYLNINRSSSNAPFDKFNGKVVTTAIALDDMVNPSSDYYFPSMMRREHNRLAQRGATRKSMLWLVNPNVDLAFSKNIIAGNWNNSSGFGRGFGANRWDMREGSDDLTGIPMDGVPLLQDEFNVNFYGNTAAHLVGYLLHLDDWEAFVDPDFGKFTPFQNTGSDTAWRCFGTVKLQLICHQPRRQVLFTDFGSS